MVNPPSPPATQQDLKILESAMQQDRKDLEVVMRQDVKDGLHKTELTLRQEMKEMESRLREEIQTNGEYLMTEMGTLYEGLEEKLQDLHLYIGMTIEESLHKWHGARIDDLENVKIRVTRLEKHTKLIA